MGERIKFVKNLPPEEKMWLTYGAFIRYNIGRIFTDRSPDRTVVGPGEPA